MSVPARRHRFAPHLLVASVGYVLFTFAALPDLLTTRLGIGLSAFGLLMSAPLTSFVVVQWPAGWLLSRFDASRILLAAGTVQALLGLTFDTPVPYLPMLALRAAWGLAGGLVLTAGSTHVSRSFAGDSATRQQGVYGGLLTLGGAIGFTLAPWLARAGLPLHLPGALLAVPALALFATAPASGASTTDRPDGSPSQVATDSTVLLAALCYVAVIGSYITLSTFVTAYLADVGVVGPLSALVLATATLGRVAGGESVWRAPVSNAGLVGGSAVLAATGFAALAVVSNRTALVVLPFAVMFAVSLPFGAILDEASRATSSAGAAIATVVAAGNVAALVLPPVTGALRETTGSYAGAFGLLALLNCLAVAAAWRLHGASRTPGNRRPSEERR
ncbi:MFS transporter [Haloarchaeobius sp. TZWWS8]|uniref:MFS transporter n=1 Tax=Haloarchaeobius sp. TZWWS8 TaxID=3446121 RepID=UPI003EBE4B8D